MRSLTVAACNVQTTKYKMYKKTPGYLNDTAGAGRLTCGFSNCMVPIQ